MKKLEEKSIGIIGMGNMGQAICSALLRLLPAKKIAVIDPHLSSLDLPQEIVPYDALAELVRDADYLFLAIKPVDLASLAEKLKGQLLGKTVISLLAAVPLASLEELLGHKKILRTMPNLPVKFAKGVLAYFSSFPFSAEEKEEIRALFSTMGLVLELDQEEKVDAITAISGSGPAYFFYLTEILEQKALDLGFSREEARKLAEMTFQGSAALLEEGEISAGEWKKKVASKKGTTEAALNELEEGAFDSLFRKAVEAAYHRAKEISKT